MKMVDQEVIGPLPNEQRRGRAGAAGRWSAKYHYSTFGGAPLLGIDGVCIICHGSSRERAIKNALGVAAQDARVQLNE